MLAFYICESQYLEIIVELLKSKLLSDQQIH